MSVEFWIAVVGIVGSLGGVLGGALLTAHFSKKRQQIEHHQRLRFAALDKRLKVHQEAFVLAYRFQELAMGDGTSDRVEGANELFDWWREHCLYLDKAVFEAWIAAVHRLQRGGAPAEFVELVETIAKAVELPSIGSAAKRPRATVD